jgi:carboxylesterase type B
LLSATEPIPETSAAEELVADALAINAAPEHAERVRDSVPLWFHTFALAPGIYTPGIARAHGYRLGVVAGDYVDRPAGARPVMPQNEGPALPLGTPTGIWVALGESVVGQPDADSEWRTP